MIKELEVDLDKLFFDPKNPRMILDNDGDQTKMFRYLVTDIGVEDLLESISSNGLFAGDPIIVRKRPAGGYYVIEGNRRLAAIKLLNGERPDDKLPIPSIPKVTSKVKATFQRVIVQIDWPQDMLQAYLGYKHVTSSREWPPEAKAKFVFEHANGDYSEKSLKKFASTLGTKYPNLKRWLTAYLMLRQAEEKKIFDPSDAPDKGYFGTFYTLVSGQQAQKFLNIKDAELTKNPVPNTRAKHLAEFIQWTIGTKDDPAVANSRQQKELEQVLASPKALEHFRVQKDLKSSLLYTEYNAEEIALKIRQAAYSVEDCLTKLFDVRSNAAVKEAFSLLEKAVEKAKLNISSKKKSS